VPGSDLREYAVHASSTDTFGRVVVDARDQHLVVDGPVQNGCPGEAITPAELFLAGVASCGVELVQVIARERNVRLRSVAASIRGAIDRDHPARTDLAVFNTVQLHFDLRGVDDEGASALVQAFKAR
jgi:uncharacterized OsmC-like protein